jgi:hypothetical protein
MRRLSAEEKWMDEQRGKSGKPILRIVSAVVALILIAAAIGFFASKKRGGRQAAATTAQQSAAGSLSDLASRNASAVSQGVHVANGDNVSVSGGDSYAHVVYAPRVKMFDHVELQSSLMGISSDGHGFVFQHASEGIRGLQPGDVMMVKGEMAAKVQGVVTDQDRTLVVVNQASIHDLVKSGEIKMDLPVRFHGTGKFARNESPGFPSMVMDLIEPPVHAQQIPQIAVGTKIAGWTVVKWSIVAADNEADYDLVMVKSEAGFEAWIGMKGWIGNFDISSNLSMPEGSSGMIQQLAAKASNLSGFATIEWEIGKSTPGVWATEDRVKLPAGISIPLAPFLGGMPLTLDISSAVLIHPGLTGNNEFAHGGFNVSFSGSGNFQSPSSGDLSGDGSMSIKDQITVSESLSPIAPNAMLIAFCAPRIELTVDVLGPFAGALGSYGGVVDKAYTTLVGKLSPNVQNVIANSPLSKMTPSNFLKSNADVYLEFVVTGAVTHAASESLFQCTSTTIVYALKAGAAASLFGLTDGAVAEKELFKHGNTRWDPPTEACQKNSS